MNQNRILYEDDNILVCHKPAGIATQSARIGQADMVSEMENHLAQNLLKNGGQRERKEKPHIHVIHRLDQPVEGILVFAKNRAAAADLGRQAAGEEMEKEYLALVCDQRGENTVGANQRSEWPTGQMETDRRLQDGTLTDYLLKNGRTNLSYVVPPETKGAQKAVLDYERISSTLLRIRLHTGRHHQIRVQLAHAGMPILGDRKYADPETISLSESMGIRDIALCAYRLRFSHPKTRERLCFEVTPEGTAFRGIRC